MTFLCRVAVTPAPDMAVQQTVTPARVKLDTSLATRIERLPCSSTAALHGTSLNCDTDIV